MSIARKLLEKHVEDPCVKWARDRGIKVRKMNGEGFASWPDRQFFFKGGRSLLIEFKRPGGPLTPEEKLTELQKETIGDLRALGYAVEVHDDKLTALASLEKHYKASIKK